VVALVDAGDAERAATVGAATVAALDRDTQVRHVAKAAQVLALIGDRDGATARVDDAFGRMLGDESLVIILNRLAVARAYLALGQLEDALDVAAGARTPGVDEPFLLELADHLRAHPDQVTAEVLKHRIFE
jgi:hypothetical protein